VFEVRWQHRIYVKLNDMKEASNLSDRSTARSRPYRSTLRQKQAEATRELILQALAQQLAEEGLQDFSIADAAQRAGVATRTIYRYFPNREVLLDAVGEWVDQQLGDLPYPTTSMEVADLAEQAFPRFEQQAVLIQALLLSKLGKSVRSRLRSKRRQSVEDALSPLTGDLDSARAVRAVIGHLVTAETWKHLRDEFGVSGEASAKAVAWAIRTLVTDLERHH
jgi:AcrR family transcriptional regulator